jgi:SWI/SNF-related matrix-associated actin-dependent regulator of chromatin subfamily A3
VRIDGNLSGSRREEAIRKFQTDDCVRVILVSITCGGTGYVRQSLPESAYSPHPLDGLLTRTSLDLTAASRAYLLEPQWNPMIEEQALSRIHRLGQTKEVKTIRYRVRGSFEEVS